MQSIAKIYNISGQNSGSNYSLAQSLTQMHSDYPMIQYHAYGKEIITNNYTLKFINFTSIINTVILMLDQTGMFTSRDLVAMCDSENAVFGINPSIPIFPSGWSPLKTAWYRGMVSYWASYHQSQYVTDIFYKAGPPRFTLSICDALVDDGLRGLVAVDVEFSKMMQLLSVTTDNLLFIYENGTILFQNAITDYLIQNQTACVYDENITGFNIDQWTLFKAAAQQTGQLSITTTYNSIFKQHMTINIKKFHNLPFYLMLFTNLQEDRNATMISQDLINRLQNESLEYGYATLGVEAFLLMVVILSLILMLRPIKRIKWHIQNTQQISQRNTMFLNQRSNNQLLNLEFFLIKLILRMKKSSMNKPDLCKTVESFKWPKKPHIDFLCSLNSITDECLMIDQKKKINFLKIIAEQQYVH